MDRDKATWWVICTFNRHELLVDGFLKERGLTSFIPMRYTEKATADGDRLKRVLQPVIHNLVFVEKTMPQQQFATLLSECNTPLYMMKNKETDHPVEISSREMLEFRMLCDPAFERQVNITLHEEEPEVGKEVEIVHGPFSGIRGRLYRKQRKYWFVKTIVGISVELRITRWYCRAI